MPDVGSSNSQPESCLCPDDPCTAGMSSPCSACNAARSESASGDAMTDDELLSGLWWDDPEYPEWAGPLWREYVTRKHAWNDYRAGVASTLRSAIENGANHA